MYRNDVRLGYFLNRSLIYENIALEYEVSKMDKEIEELKAYFEDKKQVVDMLSTITDKYANANEDILREIIVKYLS
jgi:phosphopantetheine adenylyltransferase